MTLRRHRLTQSVLILGFLLSMLLVLGADRVSIVSALGSTTKIAKNIQMSCLHQESNLDWQ